MTLNELPKQKDDISENSVPYDFLPPFTTFQVAFITGWPGSTILAGAKWRRLYGAKKRNPGRNSTVEWYNHKAIFDRRNHRYNRSPLDNAELSNLKNQILELQKQLTHLGTINER